MKQKKANTQKVAGVPACFNNIGVTCPIMVSATHITIILTPKALPLIFVGNISDATTNFNGPIENAKQRNTNN